MLNNISSGVYSDGTGSGGKQIGGLQLLVADDPTTDQLVELTVLRSTSGETSALTLLLMVVALLLLQIFKRT